MCRLVFISGVRLVLLMMSRLECWMLGLFLCGIFLLFVMLRMNS